MIEINNRVVRVGVGAVCVNDRNEILLLNRLKDPEKGKWCLPGGAIEWGEKAEEAILRECREEIGIECKVITFLGVYDYIWNEQNHWVSLFYVVAPKGTVQPMNMEMDKHTAMKWVKMDMQSGLTENTIEAIRLYGIWKERMH